MIKSKWPLDMELMSELDWNGYVMVIECVINPSKALYQTFE